MEGGSMINVRWKTRRRAAIIFPSSTNWDIAKPQLHIFRYISDLVISSHFKRSIDFGYPMIWDDFDNSLWSINLYFFWVAQQKEHIKLCRNRNFKKNMEYRFFSAWGQTSTFDPSKICSKLGNLVIRVAVTSNIYFLLLKR